MTAQELTKRYSYKASPDELAYVRSLPPEKLPTIACVIPSYNQGKFLAATLDSILEQNYPALEIFVADGGSTDDSLDILQRYAAAHPDILRHDSAPDGGQAQGVNKAMRATSGDIIAWINSDDLYLPETFWKIAAFFYYNRCALVVFGNGYVVDENMKRIGDYPTLWSPLIHEFQRMMKHQCPMSQPSLFFRRTVLDLGGNLKPGRALDYELWMRWAQNIPFYYYDDMLSVALAHKDAISTNADKKMLIETCREVHRHYNVVPMNWCMVIAHFHAYGAAWARGEHPPYTRAIRCHGLWLFISLNFKWSPWAVHNTFRRLKSSLRDNIFGIT